MNDEEKIDQESIDKLLATANLELSDQLTPNTDIAVQESAVKETVSESAASFTGDKTVSIPAKQENFLPLSLIKSISNYSRKKKIMIVIFLFLLFIAGGGFLGFQLTKKVIIEKPPLDKIIDSGITFEGRNMVSYAGRGNKEIVTAFINAGMPVNSIRATDGWTPLIAACFFKQTDIVKQLLEQQATVNIQDIYGKTPLMYASAMGAEDIVVLLLSAGADPNTQDKNGRTAIIEAYSKQQARIAEILKNAGADPTLQPLRKEEKQATLSQVKPDATTAEVSPIADATELSVGKAGFVKIGMSLEDLKKKYPNITVNDQYINGSKKSIASIYLTNKKNPSLKIELTKGKPQIVSIINTYDETFKTNKNISIKSTVGEICEQYSVSDIKVIDHSLFLVVKSMKMLFEIDTNGDGFSTSWIETNNPQDIPSNTKITRIINY